LNYATAVATLHTTALPAPCYIIVSGVEAGQGVVISRWRNGGDLWHLNLGKQRWFLPQTNDDHWEPPADNRRAAVIAGMNAIGQKSIDLDGIFKVLSTPPVLNPDMVTYTTLMSAGTGNYTAFVRFLNKANSG
jgi:N-acylethanolamine-hydrolysing acid amidase